MKSIKFFNSLFAAIFIIAGFSLAISNYGFEVKNVAVVLVSLTLIATIASSASGYNRKQTQSFLFAGIFKEVWTGEVIRRMGLLEMYTWVSAIKKDYSKYVSAVGDEAEVIHLASFTDLPDVLINNTTYPIPTQDLSTNDIVLSLNKYQTKVTPITDDELFANTTSKMANASQAHAESIIINKMQKGAHNICPTGNAAKTPVLAATGGNDGAGRKMLTFEDLLKFKRKLDAAEISDAPGSRILVLEKDHENDLCAADQKFKDQFYNFANGKPYEALNFTFFASNGNPYYNHTSLVKQSLGVTPTSAMRRATMFFSTERVVKAMGSTKAYLAPSNQNPEYQKALMNARHYHLIAGIMNEGVGAIVSPDFV